MNKREFVLSVVNGTNKRWKRGRDLSGLNLISTDLRGANLEDTDLRYSDLEGVNLRGANLEDTDLRGAILIGANLRHANLISTDLRGANLEDTDLRYAKLINANLEYTNLRGADLDFSCLPLWCGGQFKTDEKICKQIGAHFERILSNSNCGSPTLIKELREFISGWHREGEF